MINFSGWIVGDFRRVYCTDDTVIRRKKIARVWVYISGIFRVWVNHCLAAAAGALSSRRGESRRSTSQITYFRNTRRRGNLIDAGNGRGNAAECEKESCCPLMAANSLAGAVEPAI